MDPAAQADQLMLAVLAAIPDDVPPPAVGLALVGAGVLLLERAGDAATADAVPEAVERLTSEDSAYHNSV